MELPENIRQLSDHYMMPARVIRTYGKRAAVVVVPGRRPVQVRAALEKLISENKMDPGTVKQFDNNVLYQQNKL